MRLRNKETGEIKEQEIFMGDFPKMTHAATFIINGAERAIVSQPRSFPGRILRQGSLTRPTRFCSPLP